MALVIRNGLQRHIPTLLDKFFNNDAFDKLSSDLSSTSTTLPAVNIKETPDAFEVEMAAPGMRKEDFTIELDGQQLMIRSEKNNEWEQREGDRYYLREFSYQSFERNFKLAKEVVDSDKIKASYDNGMLRLFIPKKMKQNSILQEGLMSCKFYW